MTRQGSSVSTSAATAFGPVRRHPLFSTGSACWFAALFGLSALAIRPDQLEALALVAGIGRFAAVITPPLDMVARVLTAAGCAMFGGIVGLGLGRQLAIPRAAKARPQEDSPIASRDEGAESGCSEPDARAFQRSDEAGAAPAEYPPLDDSRPVLSEPPLGKAAERLLAAELTTLSPLQLVERLGIAMQCPGARAPMRIDGKPAMDLGLGGLRQISGAA